MQLLFLFISVTLYVTAPRAFSLPFCIICAILYIIHWSRIVQLERSFSNTGLLTFNLLFALSGFAVVFIFPLFVYGTTKDYSYQNLSVFSDFSVNKVTALSTLAYSVYLVAFEYYYASSTLLRTNKTYVGIKVSAKALQIILFLTAVMVLFFSLNIILFVRTKGSEYNDLTVNTYVAELTKCFLTLSLICSCERYKYKFKGKGRNFLYYCKMPIVFFLIVILEYLYIGDRGFVIVGSLMLLFAYYHYIGKIRNLILIPILVIGIVIMSLIGQLRKTDSSFREGGVSSFTSASDEILKSSINWLDFISDLTLVSNVAYLGMDYSENNKLYKPERLLVILSSPIPFMPSVISNSLYGDSNQSTSTGFAITKYYQGRAKLSGDGGTGTQVAIDLYMSWGIIGVIIGMWLLGAIIAKACINKNTNVYYLITLITFFGLAIYVPRSTIYVCFRTIVWEMLLLYFFVDVYKVKDPQVRKYGDS